MAYATAAQFRDFIGKTSGTDDVAILACINAASNAIDSHCNRPDGFVADDSASARVYPGRGLDYQYIDECVEITQVAVKDSPSDDDYTAWDVTDWIAFSGEPKNPDFNRLPYHAIMIAANGSYGVFTDGEYIVRAGFSRPKELRRRVPTIQVTAKWGYATECPDAIYTATVAQASRWWKRFKSGGFSDATVSSDMGTLAFQLRGKALDPDIAMMLTHLKRPSSLGAYQ